MKSHKPFAAGSLGSDNNMVMQVEVMVDREEASHDNSSGSILSDALEKLDSVMGLGQGFHPAATGCQDALLEDDDYEQGLTAPTTAMSCSSHHLRPSHHQRGGGAGGAKAKESGDQDWDDDSSWSSMGSDQVNGVVPMKLHANSEKEEGMDMYWHRTNSGYLQTCMDVGMDDDEDDEPIPLDSNYQVGPAQGGQVIQGMQAMQAMPMASQGATSVPFQPLPYLEELRHQPVHPHPHFANNLQHANQAPLPYLEEIKMCPHYSPVEPHREMDPLPYLLEIQRWHFNNDNNPRGPIVPRQATTEETQNPHFTMAWTRNRTFSETYTISKGGPIGEGAFGVVYSCVAKHSGNNDNKNDGAATATTSQQHHQQNRKAVKIIPAAYYNRTEIDILKILGDCPFVVTLQDIFFGFDRVFLVMEEMQGDLLSRLATKGHYPEHEARQVIQTLMQALQFLHTRGVAHRDIKPENLLMSSHNNDTMLKLADFGLAKRFRDDNGNRFEANMFTMCGSVWYTAPEVFHEFQPYDERCDIWSVGILAYLLLAGYMPFFEARNDYEVMREAKRGRYKFHPEYWGNISAAAKDLISSLLKVHPVQRSSLKEALASDWIHHDQKPAATTATADTHADRNNDVSWSRV